jgi:hypothetical protein
VNDYPDEQIAREDLPTSNSFGKIIQMQSGEIRNSATTAFMKEYNHSFLSGRANYSESGGIYYGAMIDVGDERWWEIWKDFAWVNDMFQPLSEIPNPKGSEALATSVAEVCGTGELKLGEDGNPTGVHDATGGTLEDRALNGDANMRDATQDWQGTAANQFRNDFLKDIPTIVANQTALAKTLRSVALANAGLLLAARKDAQELAIKAKAAFDSFEPGGVDEGVTTGFAVIAALATIAAGIAAAIPSGGTSLAAGLTIVAGVSSAASLAEEKADPIGLGADTVQGIIGNVSDAVNKILLTLEDGEDKLVGEVLTPSYLVTLEHPDLFVASRPTLIGAPSGDFRPPEV